MEIYWDNWEWEEGWEVLVFEQFAFSNDFKNVLADLINCFSVHGLGYWMLFLTHILLCRKQLKNKNKKIKI